MFQSKLILSNCRCGSLQTIHMASHNLKNKTWFIFHRKHPHTLFVLNSLFWVLCTLQHWQNNTVCAHVVFQSYYQTFSFSLPALWYLINSPEDICLSVLLLTFMFLWYLRSLINGLKCLWEKLKMYEMYEKVNFVPAYSSRVWYSWYCGTMMTVGFLWNFISAWRYFRSVKLWQCKSQNVLQKSLCGVLPFSNN